MLHRPCKVALVGETRAQRYIRNRQARMLQQGDRLFESSRGDVLMRRKTS
jgi:hypothetical protein